MDPSLSLHWCELPREKAIHLMFVFFLGVQIVESMSVEQRKMLLFFWTSIKSLPLGGLDSRPSIYKTSESDDHLPSSHTFFFRLCFPVYRSMEDMKDRLWMITQEHIGSSFGTSWLEVETKSRFRVYGFKTLVH